MRTGIFQSGRCRLWIGDLPFTFVDQPYVASALPSAAGHAPYRHHSAAIEIWSPHGAFAEYGLLGASVSEGPIEAGELRVTVTPEEQAQLWLDSALTSSRLLAGLPDYAVPGIFAGAARATAIRGVPESSVIKFNCGATDEVGSNESLFETLAAIIVRVLAEGVAGERELRDLVESEFAYAADLRRSARD